MRPCSWQKAKELQEEIKAAVDEQSVPLLRAALQRRHMCQGEHALHEAVRQANVPAVRLLLHGRAEPNARCLCLHGGCEFPLQVAASCTAFPRSSDRCQAVDLLLAAGALPNPRRGDAEANTPLHDAVRRGDLEVVKLLLKHTADPNVTNGLREAPLHLALRLGDGDFVPAGTSWAMAEALLQAGACPWLAATDGLVTPYRIDPELQALLARWSAWWRCRVLAWIHSRGQGHPLCDLLPEMLLSIAKFL